MTEGHSASSTVVHPTGLREAGFFGVLTHKQSYLNIAYLLLSFPLGIIYFVFAITGLSIGIGLAVILLGLFILTAMLAAFRGLAAFERQLSSWLLGVDIPPPPPGPEIWRHPLVALRKLVTDPYTWKSLFYLLAKFPLGILSFIIVVTMFSMTFSLLLAPMLYQYAQFHVFVWRISRADEALICFALGLVLGLLAVHLMNGVALVWRRFSVWMLSGSQAGEMPAKTGPIVIP
jgi:hypothetical protein